MNVFDDLIVELKEENLIEGSETQKPNRTGAVNPDGDVLSLLDEQPPRNELTDDEILEAEQFLLQLEAQEASKPAAKANVVQKETDDLVLDIGAIDPIASSENESFQDQVHNEPLDLQPKRKLSGFELFRKRAIEDVSALQMVDNIFSSVEREQIKIVPKPYNDIKVKQVLFSFVQHSGDLGADQQIQAEFELRMETETWSNALAERDQEISVQNLRYCCESTRPPLSPPALLALARFYRNSQFSEDVRNKFDLIITRLFTRDIELNRRELVFATEELIGHFKELYSEWESIPFYPIDENSSEIVETVLRFNDIVAESKRAKKFDQLIKSDFFNRVRALKRSAAEVFFSPNVAAAAIECNVEVGNRYLDLIDIEQENSSNAVIEEKYGFVYDQAVSDATNKSVHLAELLSRPRAKTRLVDLGIIDPNLKNSRKKRSASRFEEIVSNAVGGINKWVLALSLITVVLTAGLVVWVEVLSTPTKSSSEVKTINFDNTQFKPFIESARLNNEKLYVISTPEWGAMPKEKREDLLGKLLLEGANRGYDSIHLFNQKSETIGSATKTSVQVK